MTDFLDQLAAMEGRPVPEIEAPEDWKGERKIREAKRSHQNEGNYTLRRELAQRGPANPQRPAPKASVTECQAPGVRQNSRPTQQDRVLQGSSTPLGLSASPRR
jgi:hypothetical protein